jgi:hypothetical protein
VYRSSKALMNMVARTFAQQERFKSWRFNITCLGHVATNFNNYTSNGPLEIDANNTVGLAMLGKYEETGRFWDRSGPAGW